MRRHDKFWYRMASAVLLCTFCFGALTCKGASPAQESTNKRDGVVVLTKEEVLRSLRSDIPKDFCIDGIRKEGLPVKLLKTPAGDLDGKGKFWVIVQADSSASSEFYNDVDQAMKALKDRGVTTFRTCSKPLDL